MNAPREYYPVGYDKNFDDNFASRVDLPDTSFYCGDQKHFPGLYADEDLGCMVSFPRRFNNICLDTTIRAKSFYVIYLIDLAKIKELILNIFFTNCTTY